jgi:hypothetical protein
VSAAPGGRIAEHWNVDRLGLLEQAGRASSAAGTA